MSDDLRFIGTQINPDNNLGVTGYASCDGGGTATLVLTAVESDVAGAGVTSFPADGTDYEVSAEITALTGEWTTGGTVNVVGVVLNALGANVATANETVQI